jgi:MFS transporter, DHA3 family, macrolide efflux protein
VNSLRRLRLFRALSHRPIFVLWAGEATSAIGDEIYKVALVWLAVGIAGANAGYLAAGQAGAMLLFGLIGGAWADHRDPRRTMITVDIARALLVMIPVVYSWFHPLGLAVLVPVALAVSGLNAFFDPAMHAVVPHLARERELLQATNGLMGTTSRLARAIGPGLVGSLTAFVPAIHFFTLDAVSFLASAWAVDTLKRDLPKHPQMPRMGGVRDAIRSGFALVRGDPVMKYVLGSKALASGAWSIVLPLGIALIAKEKFAGDVRIYGLLLATYGVGNLSGALVMSNIQLQNPVRMMGAGFLLLGLGFLGIAAAPSLPVMLAFAAAAAIGGPMNDLAHIDYLQTRYPAQQLGRVVRFRIAVEYSGIFLALLSAPLLFQLLPVVWVIAICGLVNVVVGAAGLALHSRL